MNYRLGHRVPSPRKPIPRGISTEGLAILSYGFRPFFLLAGIFAVVSMALWIGTLSEGWEIGGHYGPLNWHAHEMLFGYASAALAGFMLTAIPNWTGRLPVSGPPLLVLVGIWFLGRIAMLAPDLLGTAGSVVADASFIPVLALVAGREIVAGRNWKNLKILFGLTGLSVANVLFHLTIVTGGDAIAILRLTISVYVSLIALVGGRIVPSFTRNWLVKAGASQLPRPFGHLDRAAIGLLLAALALWTFFPEGPLTSAVVASAAAAQALRLARWRGWATVEEPLLIVLHIAYAFVPIGLAGLSLAALGWFSAPSALHLLTVGAIGNMTLAVMTRATLGHTGRLVAASPLTACALLAILLSAVLRPFAELLPQSYHLILAASAVCWIVAFTAFLVEYAPMLVSARSKSAAAAA